MDRPTTELVLPVSKARLVLYTYLVSGEMRQIRRVTLDQMAVTMPADGKEAPKIDDISIKGSSVFDSQDLAINFIVKEAYDGEGKKVEDLKAFVYNLPISDGDVLFDKINSLTAGSTMSDEVKKK